MDNNQIQFNNSNSRIILFKKYHLLQNIGGGAFGTVFLGENIMTKEKVAIKIEERNQSKTTLEREAYILYYLKGPGLPEVKSFGKTKKYNILIQTLLGRSLYQIFNEQDKKFTIKDVCMIGLQLIERLEYIHTKNYIHRDIKPHNFLVSPKNEGQIYIIDFGLSKKYKSDRGNHVKFIINKHITGTPRFCSVNAMRGVEQSRRDDLESLSYLILYFLKGYLPWQGLKISSRVKRLYYISNMKKNVNLESLCENLPPEILLLCKYTRKLGFTEDPKYGYMKNLLNSILNKYGFVNDKKFSWMKEGADVGDDNIYNYYLHKKSPHKRLIQKITVSLEKKKREKNRDNNDYTLKVIDIENNKDLLKIINKNNSLNNSINKNYLQSNDNNILQNNIINLNIDNYKHSYNYPLIIYNKNNFDKKDNNFNKIAQNFEIQNRNILQEKAINIPDKISIIDATPSNLENFQISHNQILFISENNLNTTGNQTKGMKLHDFIRQEEKKGGVIGKDYDFKENDYFKINTPLFKSDLEETRENENEFSKYKNNIPIKMNSITNDQKKENGSLDNYKIDNNLNKNLEEINLKKPNNSFSNNLINSNYKKILKKHSTDKIQLNNYLEKDMSDYSRTIPSFQDINEEQKNKKIKFVKKSPKKYNSFYVRKVSVNINNSKNTSEFNSPVNFNKIKVEDRNCRINKNYNSRNKKSLHDINNSKKIKNLVLSNNEDKNKNSQKYNMINPKIRNLQKPTEFNQRKKIMINNNMNQSKIKNKKNIRIVNDSINNNYNANTPKINNYNKNNTKNNIINSVNDKYILTESYNRNRNFKNDQFKIIQYQLIFKEKKNNNNYKINNSNIRKNDSLNYSDINNLSNVNNVKDKMLLNKSLKVNTFNNINSENNNNLIHINSLKNERNKNIIINNLIIKNNCNNLLCKKKLCDSKNHTLNHLYTNSSQILNNKNNLLNYKPYSLRNNFLNKNNI